MLAQVSESRTTSGLLSLLVGVAAVVTVGGWMLRPRTPEKAEKPNPAYVVPVTTVPVEVGDVAEEIELVGDVLAPERAKLAFERDGRIRDLPIRLGDAVKAGSVLARLDDSVMEEEVRASEATLAQAREMAALAVRDADRLRRIQDVGATEAEIDRAEARARNEAAKVSQMEADLALVRARLRQGVLVAPFDAIVTARPVALGSYVAAGDPCCELLALERREVVLELPPHAAASARPGAAIKLKSDALPGFEVAATLHSVLPSEEIRARSFAGVVRLESRDDPQFLLRPGMFVRARLELRAARGALTVPVDCVLEDDQGARLAVVVPGESPTAGFVPVDVLARDAARAAVQPANGAVLAAGDAVIFAGREAVFPGVAIRPAGGP
jgi:RND family efflux transporter MFP subunit